MIKRPRPTPGQVTEREVVVDVCGECGCVIDQYLCDYDCLYDGANEDERRPNIIKAVYKVVETFLRDETISS